MDNIGKLMQSPDSPVPENSEENNTEYLLRLLDSEITENVENNFKINNDLENVDNFNQNTSDETNNINRSEENKIHIKNDFYFEDTKKQLSNKYSNFGNEIHKKLKENSKNYVDFKQTSNSWNKNKQLDEKSKVLSVVSNTAVKNDVYAEPVFGLKLINPIVSSTFIQSKMFDKQAVTVSNVSYHLRCGSKNVDWVFAGVVVFKTELKTSQKGSQYCLWKISDLKHDLKQITLYLFGKASANLWKVSLGTVVAVLNAVPFYKNEKVSDDEVTLTVKNADQIMIWGTSRDYGICKAKKRNGEDCTSFVNKSQCEFCIYHVKHEYNKYVGKRSNLQSGGSSLGFNSLRNKILGKNEVFYGGKSYTAVKNNKIEKRNNTLLDKLSLNTVKKNLHTKEMDNQTLAKLASPPCNRDLPINLNYSKQSLNKNGELMLYDQNHVTNNNVTQNYKSTKTDLKKLSTDGTTKNNNKPAFSRLHLIKQAGEHMLETGEITRITGNKPETKKEYFSFTDVLNSDISPIKPKKTVVLQQNDFQINKKKKVSIDKSQKMIDLSIDIRKSKFTNDFKNVINNETSTSIKNTNVKISDQQHNSEIKENVVTTISSKNSQPDKEQFKSNMSIQLFPTSGNSVREKKKTLAKMNAVNIIKKKGGLMKANPNQVRPDPLKRRSLKRPADSNEDEEVEEPIEKSVLSKRFIDLMNAQSKHENLILLAEDTERQNYFNKMEKKEQLEEKMLNTYKVPCKAVTCMKCKYKWFSASNLCRAEGHPIKVIDTVKRYFKCENCTNRTVSLEIIPLISCQQCGSSKWTKAPMMKEKLANNNSGLSIRGDEVKFLDSLSNSININLLVPLNK